MKIFRARLQGPSERPGTLFETFEKLDWPARRTTVYANMLHPLAQFFFTGDLGLASILTHPPGTHPGLILVRGFHRGTIGSLIEAVRENLSRLSEDDLRGTIIVIQPGRLRLHRPSQ